jgi:hypothetical protein
MNMATKHITTTLCHMSANSENNRSVRLSVHQQIVHKLRNLFTLASKKVKKWKSKDDRMLTKQP